MGPWPDVTGGELVGSIYYMQAPGAGAGCSPPSRGSLGATVTGFSETELASLRNLYNPVESDPRL